MGLNIGTYGVIDIKHGITQVQKAYIGSTLVWQQNTVLVLTGVANHNATSDSVTLSWNTISGASYYNIYYKLHNSNDPLSPALGITGNHITILSFAYQTTYDFYIEAYDVNDVLLQTSATISVYMV